MAPPTRARLQALRCCGASDLGSCLAVSRTWRNDADCEPTWASVYHNTQRPQLDGADADLRSLIQRPFGEAAVGWRVSVLDDEADDFTSDRGYWHGRVTAYDPRKDAYRIAYDGIGDEEGPEMWEVEHMRHSRMLQRNPSFAGKSRFLFLAPPGNDWSHASTSSSCSAGLGEQCASTAQRNTCASARLDSSLLRFGSWKAELRHNAQHAPLREKQRLNVHLDEVLFVAFSPCGTRLASCSRDCRTAVFRLRECGRPDGDAQQETATESCGSWFEQEAQFQHTTAVCRAAWWPAAPYTTLLVMTEDISYQGFHGASALEVWELPAQSSSCPPSPRLAAEPFEEMSDVGEVPFSAADCKGFPSSARCVFRERNQPFDIHTVVFPWPPGSAESIQSCDPQNLCMLGGKTISHESGRCVQWLDVWRGPTHRDFELGGIPLAEIRIQCGVNYLHALQVGPEDRCYEMIAMTGTTPHLCDQLALVDLRKLQPRGEGEGGTLGDDARIEPYNLQATTRFMGQRHLLSAKWSRGGELLLLNTRPHANAGHGGAASSEQTYATFDEAMRSLPPDLSTSIELMLLDSRTLECVGTFDGHYAFTTKVCPFSIYVDDWENSDFLASGGEDGHVYIWHRRHGRLLRRLSAHTASVNAVSYNGRGLLASGSDDHSIIIWSAAPSAQPT